jgi:hypothetical protein
MRFPPSVLAPKSFIESGEIPPVEAPEGWLLGRPVDVDILSPIPGWESKRNQTRPFQPLFPGRRDVVDWWRENKRDEIPLETFLKKENLDSPAGIRKWNEKTVRKIVERPAQKLVMDLLDAGKKPILSNAFGPGKKAVRYIDPQTKKIFFLPLMESDYRAVGIEFNDLFALSYDFLTKELEKTGWPVPVLTPEQRASMQRLMTRETTFLVHRDKNYRKYEETSHALVEFLSSLPANPAYEVIANETETLLEWIRENDYFEGRTGSFMVFVRETDSYKRQLQAWRFIQYSMRYSDLMDHLRDHPEIADSIRSVNRPGARILKRFRRVASFLSKPLRTLFRKSN